MDGPECCEIPYSYVKNTLTLRYDAEYYQKSYIDIEKFILCHRAEFKSIEELGLNVDASAFYPSLEPFYNTGNIPFIRVADVKNYIDYNNCVCIPIMGSDFSTLHKCYPGDIVLTKGGRVGTAGLITKISYVTRDLITIDSSRLPRESYITLYLYLSSNFAFRQMLRSSSMTAQPHLTITLIKTLLIKEFSHLFKIKMRELYDRAENAYLQAQAAYAEAEKLLAYALTNRTVFEDAAPKAARNTSIKTLGNSFLVSGRLDAEYYQPKYDALFETLSKFPSNKLGGENGIVKIMKSIEPGSNAYVEEGIPFVRVSDISKFEISEPEIKICNDVVSDPKELFPQKDTILLSKDGSVGIAYKVESTLPVITSGALLHLTIRDKTKVLPDYLTLMLNSPIVQLQAERDSNGAIIQHWKPSEIENVIIPILDMEIQKEIAAQVQKSFAFRKQSKQILEYAKQAVEMAIERGEAAALKWIKGKPTEEV